jgi:hypothetical protein
MTHPENEHDEDSENDPLPQIRDLPGIFKGL